MKVRFCCCCVDERLRAFFFCAASMFLFVTAWTPALEQADCAGSCSASGQTGPPLGLIFSSFMAACMFGSQLFGVLRDSWLHVHVRTEMLLATTCALGALSLAAAASRGEKRLSRRRGSRAGSRAGSVASSASRRRGSRDPSVHRAD